MYLFGIVEHDGIAMLIEDFLLSISMYGFEISCILPSRVLQSKENSVET